MQIDPKSGKLGNGYLTKGGVIPVLSVTELNPPEPLQNEGHSPQESRPVRVRVRTQTILLGILIFALLGWGIFAMSWTFPNDQGSILDSIVQGEDWTYTLPQYILTPGSQNSTFLDLEYSNPSPYPTVPAARGLFDYSAPKPSFNLLSSTANYVTFTTLWGPNASLSIWYTGPRGNLTPYATRNVPGPQRYPWAFYLNKRGERVTGATSFLEAPIAGNYTAHFQNIGLTNATVTEIFASTHIVFSKPYFAFGLVTAILAVAYPAIAEYVRRRKASSRKEDLFYRRFGLRRRNETANPT